MLMQHPNDLTDKGVPSPEWIARDPMAALEYFKKISQRKNEHGDKYLYLLTFTANPNSRYGGDVDKWKDRVERELRKSLFKSVQSHIEHEDANYHVHALVEATKSISRLTTKPHPNFEVFRRDYGFVDVRRVLKDNGITEYITKENQVDFYSTNVH